MFVHSLRPIPVDRLFIWYCKPQEWNLKISNPSSLEGFNPHVADTIAHHATDLATTTSLKELVLMENLTGKFGADENSSFLFAICSLPLPTFFFTPSLYCYHPLLHIEALPLSTMLQPPLSKEWKKYDVTLCIEIRRKKIIYKFQHIVRSVDLKYPLLFLQNGIIQFIFRILMSFFYEFTYFDSNLKNKTTTPSNFNY